MPRISVIVPFYNRSQTIKRCLNSVKQQSHEDFECLIINDGSSRDESVALQDYVRQLEDNRFLIIQSSQNQGGGAARNLGINNSRGEYVAFLDSDDEWMPTKLELQLKAAVEGNVDFLSCQSIVHYGNGEGVLPTKVLGQERIANYLFKMNGYLPTPALFILRSTIRDVRFDEELPRHQDYDLLLQLENIGIRPKILEMPLVHVHWEDMHASGRSINIPNSIHFLATRKSSFSHVAASCFWVQFVVIPTILSVGRIQGVRALLRTTPLFVLNQHLFLNTASHFIFRDDRLLNWIGQILDSLKTRHSRSV